MNSLPEELQQEILFSLKEPRDIYRLCATSRQNRQTCADSSFWREKFRRENLPLLEEGDDLAQWLDSYKRALGASRTASRLIESRRMVEIRLDRVPFVELLKPLDEDALVEVWTIMHEKENLERHPHMVITRDGIKEEEMLVIHNYLLVLYPKGNNYLREIEDEQEEITTTGNRKEISSLPTSTLLISKEDLWFMIYQLAFFGYPFLRQG